MLSNEPCDVCGKCPTTHKLDDEYYCEECWDTEGQALAKDTVKSEAKIKERVIEFKRVD